MNTEQITKLAIQRHDIDAKDFQKVYLTQSKDQLNKREAAFLAGRSLVIEELQLMLANIPKGSKILDVGCGTAHLTHWIKQQGYEVYGIEPSNEMYHFASTNFPDIEIKKAISSNIPYPDGFFSLVVAFEVLRYLDPKENDKTFKEFRRVLQPNGYFFITQVNLFCTDAYFIFHNIKAKLYSIKNKVHHFCNFTTPAEQEQFIKNAGFSEVNTIGRFSGFNRLLYRISSKTGDLYYNLANRIYNKQRFEQGISKYTAAHLIVIAKK